MPPSPSALIAHLRQTPLGGSSLASLLSKSGKIREGYGKVEIFSKVLVVILG